MRNSSFLIKYKLHHLLFWMLLFGVWYFLRYDDYSTTAKALKITLIKVIDLMVMVYITNYLLIPRLLYKKEYAWFAGTFVLMILISSYTKMYIIGQVLNNPGMFTLNGNFKSRVYDNVIPHFFLVIAGGTFKLLADYNKAQRHLVEMAKEKAEAELNFLKSQINPHFLFNSLNSVYFLIDKQNPEARVALHKFSEMLRYQLYECNGPQIGIEKEISYLKDFVDLQGLRKDDNFKLQFNCTDGVKGFFIEPLLLIPFVENSFKHLSHHSNGKANEININICRLDGEMIFSVSNTIEKKHNPAIPTEGGIGLANVKRRLELLYPAQHQLAISQKDGWFDVELKIKIDPSMA